MTVNSELSNVNDLLTSNKLTLNTKKSNCVIFRPLKNKFKMISRKFVSLAMI